MSTNQKIMIVVGVVALIVLCACSGIVLSGCAPTRNPAPNHTVYVTPTRTSGYGYTPGRTPAPKKTLSTTKRTPTPKSTKRR